jgi:hypothetical protein
MSSDQWWANRELARRVRARADLPANFRLLFEAALDYGLECTASYSTLGKAVGVSERTARRCFKKLNGDVCCVESRPGLTDRITFPSIAELSLTPDKAMAGPSYPQPRPNGAATPVKSTPDPGHLGGRRTYERMNDRGSKQNFEKGANGKRARQLEDGSWDIPPETPEGKQWLHHGKVTNQGDIIYALQLGRSIVVSTRWPPRG